MTNTESTIITTPKVIFSIRSGFDALTENLGLLIFPFVLDMFLWFGPHLGFFSVIEKMINDIKNAPDMMLNQDLESIMEANQDIWLLIGKKFNVFTALRTYPVGVPSIQCDIIEDNFNRVGRNVISVVDTSFQEHRAFSSVHSPFGTIH